jgi:hypothetical protein
MRDQPAKLVPPSNRKAAFFFAHPPAACRYDALISQCSVAVAAFFSPDPALRSARYFRVNQQKFLWESPEGNDDPDGEANTAASKDPGTSAGGKNMGVVYA